MPLIYDSEHESVTSFNMRPYMARASKSQSLPAIKSSTTLRVAAKPDFDDSGRRVACICRGVRSIAVHGRGVGDLLAR